MAPDNNKNKESNGISPTNMLFNIVTKNTEVMTKLCEALDGVKDTLSHISNHCDDEKIQLRTISSRYSIIQRLLIGILVVSVAIFIILALGGEVGWLIDIIENVVKLLI